MCTGPTFSELANFRSSINERCASSTAHSRRWQRTETIAPTPHIILAGRTRLGDAAMHQAQQPAISVNKYRCISDSDTYLQRPANDWINVWRWQSIPIPPATFVVRWLSFAMLSGNQLWPTTVPQRSSVAGAVLGAQRLSCTRQMAICEPRLSENLLLPPHSMAPLRKAFGMAS